MKEHKGFTPGPWKWGEGWTELLANPPNRDDGYSGPKYCDTQLYGANDEEILPIRIDHHEIIWDSAKGLLDSKRADRELIADAPNLYQKLVAVRNAMRLAKQTGDLEGAMRVIEEIVGK